METVTEVIFLSSKIIADGDCSHELKRCLLFGRKAMTNLVGLLRSRDIILPTEVCIVKYMVFPVVVYRCENRTVKKAKHWRIDAFELWCWRRLLRVPWTEKRSNQSILKEINPEYSSEGLMLKLKLQHFGHLMLRAGSLEKTLKLGKLKAERDGDDRGWDGFMVAPTQWTCVSKLQEILKDREAWRAAVHEVSKSQTWLSDWTTKSKQLYTKNRNVVESTCISTCVFFL